MRKSYLHSARNGLVRNGDRTILSRNWAVIKGDTGTEGPVIIVVISGTQRDAVSIFKAFMFLEQRVATG